VVRRNFGELYESFEGIRQDTIPEHFGRYFSSVINESIEQRMVESAEIGKEYNINMERKSFYEYHAFKRDYYQKIKAQSRGTTEDSN
jgi:hypothetical protein